LLSQAHILETLFLLPHVNLLGGKPLKWEENALFLVFLGIYYFYGILDRQKKSFFKCGFSAVKETSCSHLRLPW
jgi:hypothetical protein